MNNKHRSWLIIGIVTLLVGACLVVGVRAIYCDFYERCVTPETQILEGVQVTLWSERGWYAEGETIRVRARVKNVTDQSILLESLDDTSAFDLRYVFESEAVYWSAQNPGRAAHQLELEPGKSFEIEFVFIPTQSGVYGFTAYSWTPVHSYFHADILVG